MHSCWIILLAAGLSSETFGFLTTVPENAAVIEGTTVVMKCRTNDTMKKILWRAPMTEKLPRKIFDGERFAKEWSEICYVNNSLPGQYDLIINSTMSAGTQYVCQEGTFGHVNGSMGAAELVVLASHPNCSTNIRIKDDNVSSSHKTIAAELFCTLRFSGNWIPMLEWRKEGSVEAISTGVNNTIEAGTLNSILTIPTRDALNLTRYICTTRFDKSHKPSTTTAENVPQYSYNWTSPMINIMGEETTFSATGQHSAHYLNSSSLVVLMMAVLLLILISVTLPIVLRFTACKKIERELDIDIPLRNHLLQDAENSQVERMPPAGAACEEVDLENASDDHTTGEPASENQYTAVINERKISYIYEKIHLPNSADNL